MVPERLLRSVIYAEAFALTVIIHAHGLAFPVLVALDAEVVVALGRKGGKP